MAENKPVTLHGSTFDMTDVSYVEGYDDPEANVVFVRSDNRAFRVHDYFLKAESIFFGEMFQDCTQDGPIGFEESSGQLHFIFDRVTKRPLVDRKTHLEYLNHTHRKLVLLLELESICRKYMFDTASTSLHPFIAKSAHQCPPRALAFAISCDPPNAMIAKSALCSFNDQIKTRTMSLSSYFVGQLPGKSWNELPRYSPAAENLSWSFVEGLGLKAYCSYVRALKSGSTGEGTWDWVRVAAAFLREMGISTPGI